MLGTLMPSKLGWRCITSTVRRSQVPYDVVSSPAEVPGDETSVFPASDPVSLASPPESPYPNPSHVSRIHTTVGVMFKSRLVPNTPGARVTIATAASFPAPCIKKFTLEDFKNMHEDFVLQSGGTIDEDEIEKNRNKETQKIEKKIPTHEKTLKLVEEGMSVKEIAKEREMTVGTIISHLEKLKEAPYNIDLSKFKPKAVDLKKIKEAFKGTKEKKLAPAHRKLKGKYSYEELRLARLFV